MRLPNKTIVIFNFFHEGSGDDPVEESPENVRLHDRF